MKCELQIQFERTQTQQDKEGALNCQLREVQQKLQQTQQVRQAIEQQHEQSLRYAQQAKDAELEKAQQLQRYEDEVQRLEHALNHKQPQVLHKKVIPVSQEQQQIAAQVNSLVAYVCEVAGEGEL